jgi:hypothetical protein
MIALVLFLVAGLGLAVGGVGGDDDVPADNADPSDETPPADPSDMILPAGTEHTTGDPGGFNIELVFEGEGWTEEVRNLAIQAGEQLSDVITADIPDHNGVDDIRIDVRLEAIDGESNILGRGGPDAVRPGSLLPYEGQVVIDSADAQSSSFATYGADLFLHEMLHALGFGTIWEARGLVQQAPDGSERFTGTETIAEYAESYPTEAAADPQSAFGVPLSGDEGHWEEDAFGTEIGTPFLSSTNTMSELTLASLEDLGYKTIRSNPIT